MCCPHTGAWSHPYQPVTQGRVSHHPRPKLSTEESCIVARESRSGLLLGVGLPLPGPQTSTWLQAGAQTTDSSMGFGGNLATDINPVLGYTRTSATAWTMGLKMTSGDYICHPQQHAPLPDSKAQGHHQDLQGIQQRHRVHISTRISGTTTRTTRYQHGLQAVAFRPWCPSRRSNPESESFLISGFHHCPKLGRSEAWQ